jgi:hypothetical protein
MTQDHSQPGTVSLTVFDDYVATSSTGANATVTAYTSDDLSEKIGFYDQLSIQVVVDDTAVGTAPASLTVQIQHSANGRNYVAKNASPEVSSPTQLNIGQPTYMAFGFDAGNTPSLAFVRLAIVLTSSVGPVRAHVRVTVVANNFNEQAFARTAQNTMKDQLGASRKYVVVYGSGQKITASIIDELVSFIYDLLPKISSEQLAEQVQDARDVLGHTADHTQDEISQARAILRWEPIIVLRDKGAFKGQTITIPDRLKIAFLNDGHYVLLRDDEAMWLSSKASGRLFPKLPQTGDLHKDSVGVGVKEK